MAMWRLGWVQGVSHLRPMLCKSQLLLRPVSSMNPGHPKIGETEEFP